MMECMGHAMHMTPISPAFIIVSNGTYLESFSLHVTLVIVLS